MRRRVCWPGRPCGIDSSDETMNPSGSPDGFIPDFRKPGFTCLPHCGKFNENNGLNAFARLASTLQYKRHGHPRPNYYSKQGDNR